MWRAWCWWRYPRQQHFPRSFSSISLSISMEMTLLSMDTYKRVDQWWNFPLHFQIRMNAYISISRVRSKSVRRPGQSIYSTASTCYYFMRGMHVHICTNNPSKWFCSTNIDAKDRSECPAQQRRIFYRYILCKGSIRIFIPSSICLSFYRHLSGIKTPMTLCIYKHLIPP